VVCGLSDPFPQCGSRCPSGASSPPHHASDHRQKTLTESIDATAHQQYNVAVGRDMGPAKPRPASGQLKMVKTC
jgi:hypothetical protein